jgi:hypothetical protein
MIKIPIKKMFTCLLPILGGLLLMAGCSTFNPSPAYQEDFTTLKPPQMSLQEATDSLKHSLSAMYYNNGSTSDNPQVTSDGFSIVNRNKTYSFKFDDFKSITVSPDSTTGFGGYDCYGFYLGTWSTGFSFYWRSLNDAKAFVDAVEALKFYNSKANVNH